MAQPSRFPRFFILVVATVALLSQSASAWSFLWRDDEGLATIETGRTNQSCKAIDHGKNQPFEWDPKSGRFCISVFGDRNCQQRAGYSCTPWPHDSSRNLKAFEVNGTLTDDDAFKTTTTEAAASTTTSATSSLKTSVTKDPPTATGSSTSLPQTGAGDSGNDALSGGAIAGIVIGIVAVVVLVIIAWILFRRYRRTQGPSTAGYSASGSGSVPPMSESGATTATATTAVGSAPPIAKWGAPTSPVSPEQEPTSPAPAYSPTPPDGTRAAAELSNSHQIVELEGSDPMPPISSDTRHEKPAN